MVRANQTSLSASSSSVGGFLACFPSPSWVGATCSAWIGSADGSRALTNSSLLNLPFIRKAAGPKPQKGGVGVKANAGNKIKYLFYPSESGFYYAASPTVCLGRMEGAGEIPRKEAIKFAASGDAPTRGSMVAILLELNSSLSGTGVVCRRIAAFLLHPPPT